MFKERVKIFYRPYVSQWDKYFQEIKGLAWTLLDAIPYWSTVEKPLIKVTKFRNDLNNNETCDGIKKNYANRTKQKYENNQL